MEQPRPPIRVLIVDGYSNHDWKQTTLLTRNILSGTGLVSVDVSTSPPTEQSSAWDTWRPCFADYDVVVQNCNSLGGGPGWARAVRRDLESFVSGGGGLLALHSANNAFPEWDEYSRMIGLGWRDRDFGPAVVIDAHGSVVQVPAGEGENTGHGPRFDAVVTRLGEHAIHKGLPRRWKIADSEIYWFARGPAKNLTVLSHAREPETGLNFPVEWCVGYGQGRVYSSVMGHLWPGDTNPPGMRCVAFQTLLIRAVEWLRGGEVTYPVPEDFPDERIVRLRPG